MTFAITEDKIRLYVECTGSGTPLVFVHEFAGDTRSWEPQLRHFSRQYQTIAFNARGFPPSDVPEQPEMYSQQKACDDIRAVLDHLEIEKAHVVGLSMGGFATLHFGFNYPERALSLCIGGAGYGAEPDKQSTFQNEASAIAEFMMTRSPAEFADMYAHGPTRVQFENKDPRGFAEFKRMLSEHSALGSANTQLGVQRQRPSLYSLVDLMQLLKVPTLIVTGDEDWPCLQPALLMKEHISTAALAVIPNCGHTLNLEAPYEFNRILGDFISLVDSGRWPARDPRAISTSISGMKI